MRRIAWFTLALLILGVLPALALSSSHAPQVPSNPGRVYGPLALNGALDKQVLPPDNLPAIEQALREGGNTHFTIKELPGLNHLFQTAKTGNEDEYGKIEETMSPLALDTIAKWIEGQTKQK